MFKNAMLVLVALALTACATAPAPSAPQAKAGGCDWPPFIDKNERFAPKLGMFACGQ